VIWLDAALRVLAFLCTVTLAVMAAYWRDRAELAERRLHSLRRKVSDLPPEICEPMLWESDR
jgi:hypothetical protein